LWHGELQAASLVGIPTTRSLWRSGSSEEELRLIALNFGSLRTPQLSRIYKRRQELFSCSLQILNRHFGIGNLGIVCPPHLKGCELRLCADSNGRRTRLESAEQEVRFCLTWVWKTGWRNAVFGSRHSP
jgi:hypothetical protein